MIKRLIRKFQLKFCQNWVDKQVKELKEAAAENIRNQIACRVYDEYADYMAGKSTEMPDLNKYISEYKAKISEIECI